MVVIVIVVVVVVIIVPLPSCIPSLPRTYMKDRFATITKWMELATLDSYRLPIYHPRHI